MRNPKKKAGDTVVNSSKRTRGNAKNEFRPDIVWVAEILCKTQETLTRIT